MVQVGRRRDDLFRRDSPKITARALHRRRRRKSPADRYYIIIRYAATAMTALSRRRVSCSRVPNRYIAAGDRPIKCKHFEHHHHTPPRAPATFAACSRIRNLLSFVKDRPASDRRKFLPYAGLRIIAIFQPPSPTTP